MMTIPKHEGHGESDPVDKAERAQSEDERKAIRGRMRVQPLRLDQVNPGLASLATAMWDKMTAGHPVDLVAVMDDEAIGSVWFSATVRLGDRDYRLNAHVGGEEIRESSGLDALIARTLAALWHGLQRAMRDHQATDARSKAGI